MFEKFTERSRKVMSLSRRNAQQMNHDWIGAEHMLLGILDEGGGCAAKVLKKLGVDFEAMKKEIYRRSPPKTEPSSLLGQLPYTPRVKKVLEISGEEACRAGEEVIGTEHLLLGLFGDREGVPFQVMSDLKITLEALRAKITEFTAADPRKSDKATTPAAAVPAADLINMKVWVFKGGEPTGQNQGKLFYKEDRVDVESVSTVIVKGIPADTKESVAAAIAINCNAVAFMIEVLKPGSPEA